MDRITWSGSHKSNRRRHVVDSAAVCKEGWMMKLSFWTLGMPAWSNAEFAERAAELGYGGVDVHLTNGGNLTIDASEPEIDNVMRTYSSKGIEVSSLLAY